ncbi:MAG: TIGR03936 family radical SAM-associated protein [Candidatus Margulisbacteria bacterium]|nr:TIGR03936 family radical SAM-associated protein [Candidatus Margulisiibacteriota bacterium]MBU1022622.1 TIGR03936 family radical SAM-associated protein [Candidatus Margulisiibacteriota bacterium]MBU1729441.1 TIGR03936 family radical SAM-associated protein [Candidatus Margulisiibacteriota bacterium]MBU1955458.1 TIGR03936 family radical SAM-associated protein [Candidatus Margulisiibacteriota bacterium]
MQKVRVIYKKVGPAKYISHLDWMKILERALRRTNLPVKYSEGFNPRMKIEYGPPLPVGVDGLAEALVVEFDGWIKPNSIKPELEGKFPEGLEILNIEIANPKATSLDAAAEASEYTFELEENEAKKLKSKLGQILEQNDIFIDKKSKTGIKKTNIRPMIYAASLSGTTFSASLQTTNHGTLRPRELCAVLDIHPLKIVRNKILFR